MNRIHKLLNVAEGEEFLIGDYASLFKIEDGLLKQRQQGDSWVDIKDTKTLIQIINGELKIIRPQKTPWISEEIPLGQKYYFIDVFGSVQSTKESGDIFDAFVQVTGNKFNSREYAEKIAFKQMLERGMQCFSDENGGLELTWGIDEADKYYIYLQGDTLLLGGTRVSKGNHVYFKTRKVAEQAIELFGDDIKQAFK